MYLESSGTDTGPRNTNSAEGKAVDTMDMTRFHSLPGGTTYDTLRKKEDMCETVKPIDPVRSCPGKKTHSLTA